MSILVFSTTGKYVTKSTLEKARTDSDCVGKTIVVTSELTSAQSDIVAAWPADRALRVEKGGSINNTTDFIVNGPFYAGVYQVFAGAGDVVFQGSTITTVYPEWWGECDGNADDVQIQAAVSCVCASGSTASKVKLQNKTYSISTPIGIYRYNTDATRYEYVNCEIVGETVASDTMKMPVITTTFKDRPAFWTQQSRAVAIRNIEIIGLNTISMTVPEIMTSAPASFVVNSCRDSANSPYCAICIDPFAGNISYAPDGGYPSMAAYYQGAVTSNGSSRVTVDGCVIQNFVVGVMITPNTRTQNAENIRIDYCWIDHCKVGIAIGQSQSRSVVVNDITCWGQTYVLFDSLNYGTQAAPSPVVTGGNIAGSVQNLIFAGLNYGTMSMTNLYAESLGSIGILKNGNGGLPCNFTGCYFHFNDPVSTTSKTRPWVIWADGPVKFDSCYLGYYNGTNMPLNVGPYGNNYVFENCSLDTVVLSTTHNYQAGNLKFVNCTTRYAQGGYGGTFSTDSTIYPNTNAASVAGKLVGSNSTIRAVSYGGDLADFIVEKHELWVYLASKVVTVSGVSATFSDSAGKIQVDDFIYLGEVGTHTGLHAPDASGAATLDWQGFIGKVSSVSGGTVTIPNVPSLLVDGTYTLWVVAPAYWRPPTQGDTTSGSNVITNASCTIGGIVAAWAVGARVYGTGIPDGAYVVSRDATSITLSANATATNTTVMFYEQQYTIKAENYVTPSTGIWRKGDIVWNNDPASAESIGWVCTVSGTPGTWKAFGTIA
jgi:hypothetical protein